MNDENEDLRDAEFIHNVIMTMNKNQYNGGKDSNKSTVMQLKRLLEWFAKDEQDVGVKG